MQIYIIILTYQIKFNDLKLLLRELSIINSIIKDNNWFFKAWMKEILLKF